MLQTEGAARAFLPYLDEMFEDGLHRDVWHVLSKLVQKFRRLPTQREVVAYFAAGSPKYKHAGPLDKRRMLEDLRRLYTIPTTEATQTVIGSWIAQQKLSVLGAAVHTISPVEMAEELIKVQGLFNKLLGLLSAGSRTKTALLLDDEFFENLMHEEAHENRDPFPTPWPRLNAFLPYGGIHRGELLLVIGRRSKSFTMLNIAAESVRRGRRVIFLTGEGGVKMVANRFFRWQTGLSAKEETTIEEKRRRRKEWAAAHTAFRSDLFLADVFAAQQFTTDSLRAYVERKQEEYGTVDQVVVDYWDLVGARTVYKDSKRFGLAEIGQEFVNLAVDKQVSFVTGSQPNRAGHDIPTLTTTTVGECIDKIHISTYVVTVNRTEDEKAAGKGRLALAKNRHGTEDVQVPVDFDLDRARIEDDVSRPVLDHMGPPPKGFTGSAEDGTTTTIGGGTGKTRVKKREPDAAASFARNPFAGQATFGHTPTVD